MTRYTPRALAAGKMVDERNAASVCRPRHDLVPEHSAGRCRCELLQIRAAQPAREHVDQHTGAVGLVNLCENGLTGAVQNDRPHGAIVRRRREEETMPIKLHRCSNVWVKFQGHPCW